MAMLADIAVVTPTFGAGQIAALVIAVICLFDFLFIGWDVKCADKRATNTGFNIPHRIIHVVFSPFIYLPLYHRLLHDTENSLTHSLRLYNDCILFSPDEVFL